MATNPAEESVNAFVDEREEELGRRYLAVDGPEAQDAWHAIVDELPSGEFKTAVVEELVARGYLDARLR